MYRHYEERSGAAIYVGMLHNLDKGYLFLFCKSHKKALILYRKIYIKLAIMILVTVTEFRNNLSKYLELAFREKVVLKSKQGIIELNPSTEIRINPSPSKDSYFDIPENIEAIERGLEQVDAGQCRPWSEVKEELGL